jgi:D-aminopeptidase
MRATLLLLVCAVSAHAQRPRLRELGVTPGIFAPGPFNAITDVAGVRVGHATVVRGDSVRTGVTAVLPHAGDPYLDRVPAAIHVGNGFGKLTGSTQVAELGELESPVVLTCTLCVWKVADAVLAWALARPGMERVRSYNPVVAETNDGRLNVGVTRPITAADVHAALDGARGGPVPDGAVGAGAGTVAFGWKAGIGSSSRVLPSTLGGHTVGVLVQSNFGGVLQMGGVEVGQALGQYAFRGAVEPARPAPPDGAGDGSIIVVVATDAPLDARNLRRLASRAMLGIGRTGGTASNGSGDYAIAFSTATAVRRRPGDTAVVTRELPNEATSALFQAVVEATEEAIHDSLLRAESVDSRLGRVEALPVARVRELLRARR